MKLFKIAAAVIAPLLLGGISTNAQAGAASWDSPQYTTCYIFKNNKKQGKYSCSFTGLASGTYNSYYADYTVNVPAMGSYWITDDNGTARLNGQSAKFRIRSGKTLKVTSNLGIRNGLECYKNSQGFELCFKRD